MPEPIARRALYFICLAALALLAIVATGFVSHGMHTQGAAPTGASRPLEPTWEQLMGRSVQARKAGAVREAGILLERAVSLTETLDPRDMRRAHTRMAQAEFHLWSGQPEVAEREYREAVSIGETIGGPGHPEMVRLLEGLANFYFYRERYDEVAPIAARILEIVRAAIPRDPHEEARRLRNLAQVQQLRRRFVEAQPLYLEAVRIVESSPEHSPAEIAEYLQATAECFSISGKARRAEPLAARALELMEGLVGADELGVVPYLQTSAEASLGAGHPRRASVLYARAIMIVERTSGAGHPDLRPYLLGLSSALRAQGQSREADALVERAGKVSDTASPVATP